MSETRKILSLHRCKVCGTRWLLWPAGAGGTTAAIWNLLDKYSTPGSCCNNAPMDDQMEHLRDLPLTMTDREERPNVFTAHWRWERGGWTEQVGHTRPLKDCRHWLCIAARQALLGITGRDPVQAGGSGSPASTPEEPKEPDVVPLDDPNVPESLVPIPQSVGAPSTPASRDEKEEEKSFMRA